MAKPLYKIIGWHDTFENNRTREMQVMRWTPIPNSFDGDRISDLIHRGGASAYGAWCALLGVAGRCDERGTLLRSTRKPHDSSSLEIVTGIPAQAFDKMFALAIDVGLIEVCVIPQEGAEKCANPAGVAHPSDDGIEGNRREGNRREQKGTELPSFPPPLNTPEFASAWADWTQHKIEIKKRLTPLAASRQLKKLAKLGHDRAIAAIEHSIAHGWAGVYESKDVQRDQHAEFDITLLGTSGDLTPEQVAIVNEVMA